MTVPGLRLVRLGSLQLVAGKCVCCGRGFACPPRAARTVMVHPTTRCPIRPDGKQVTSADPDAVRRPVCTWCASELVRAARRGPQALPRFFPFARLNAIRRRAS